MKYYLYYQEKMGCGCCRGAEGIESFDDLDRLHAEYPDDEYTKIIIHGTEIE